MKEYAKKAAAVLLAGTMLLGMMSACTQDTPTGSGSPAPTGSSAQPRANIRLPLRNWAPARPSGAKRRPLTAG